MSFPPSFWTRWQMLLKAFLCSKPGTPRPNNLIPRVCFMERVWRRPGKRWGNLTMKHSNDGGKRNIGKWTWRNLSFVFRLRDEIVWHNVTPGGRRELETLESWTVYLAVRNWDGVPIWRETQRHPVQGPQLAPPAPPGTGVRAFRFRPRRGRDRGGPDHRLRRHFGRLEIAKVQKLHVRWCETSLRMQRQAAVFHPATTRSSPRSPDQGQPRTHHQGKCILSFFFYGLCCRFPKNLELKKPSPPTLCALRSFMLREQATTLTFQLVFVLY